MSRLERWFEPDWAGGWTLCRWLYALIALGFHLPRVQWMADAYADHDFLYSRPPLSIPDWWILTPTSATVLWALGTLALLMVLWGGRLTKPALVLWILSSTILVCHEGLNWKAYDRLHVWIGIAMLMGPVSERNLQSKGRSPVGRWMMILVFCSLYGMTGWTKAMEPGWWGGQTLAYHLVDMNFGHQPLGIWLSAFPLITQALAVITIAFECLFPLAICWRRSNPWVIAVGIVFHLSLLVLMNVGPFSIVTLCAYPVLLHPQAAERLWSRHVQRERR